MTTRDTLRVYYHHPKEHTAIQAEQMRHLLDDRIELVTGDEATDFDIIIAGQVTPEVLERSSRVKAVIIPWVGVNPTLRETLLARPDISLHNSHWNAQVVAEFAFGLMFAATKNIIPPDRNLRKGAWEPWDNPALLVGGKHALVLGYGRIGQHLVRLCRGVGMRVSALRRSATTPTEVDGINLYPPASLSELLPTVDYLFIAVPLTAETKGLIGQEALALLPNTAILVNVGRGPIVEEAALYHALRAGHLHAAALDVWYTYPKDDEARQNTFPATYPFHELDNCVLSPHHAAALDLKEHDNMRVRDLAEMLNAYVRGKPLPNPVDLERGY